MTVKEERTVWNQAIRAATKRILDFDGIIPSKVERTYIKDKIEEDLLYKRLIGNREFKQKQKSNNK